MFHGSMHRFFMLVQIQHVSQFFITTLMVLNLKLLEKNSITHWLNMLKNPACFADELLTSRNHYSCLMITLII